MAADTERRVVLFDVGGVLVNSRPCPEHIAGIIGNATPDLVNLVDQAMWAHRDAYDAGCSDRDFWDSVSGDCGKPKVSEEVLAQLVEYDAMRVHNADRAATDLINDLKTVDATLGILSNAPHPIAEQLRLAPWSRPFTHYFFSCEIGACKPHRAIYRAALESLGVEPSRVVFFDDRKKNVRAAELVGMCAFVWNGADAARAQLADLGYFA